MCLCVRVQSLSCVQFFVAPWTVACQTPLFMEFSWWKYWSGLPFALPGDLPDPRIKNLHLLHLLYWQADSLPLHHLGSSVVQGRLWKSKYGSPTNRKHSAPASKPGTLSSHLLLATCSYPSPTIHLLNSSPASEQVHSPSITLAHPH